MASSTQTTAGKKELRVRKAPLGSMLEFHYEGGGEVPDMLKGFYTDLFSTEVALKLWESSKTPPAPAPIVRKYSGKPVKA